VCACARVCACVSVGRGGSTMRNHNVQTAVGGFVWGKKIVQNP